MVRRTLKLLFFIVLTIILSACRVVSEANIAPLDSDSAAAKVSGAKRLERQPGKVMLMLGQDSASVNEYVSTGRYPVPAGVTTYLAFYNLMSPDFPAYGALGQDVQGKVLANVDWGAGPLNATLTAQKYPDSALVIGLNIAEGNAQQVWAPGGLKAIADGRYDSTIRRLAKFCNGLNRSVYLRIGYEFDGVWNKGYENSTDYIAAYRHIVNVMRGQGVNNVAYVWQASTSPVDDLLEGQREDIKRWYPGDNYVDWLGLSWFNAPDQRYKDAPTQRELADEVLRLARAKQKPVMVAEAAPQGFDLSALTVSNRSPLLDGKAGGNVRKLGAPAIWQQWFAPFFRYVRHNADVIGAVAYINADWDSQPMWNVPYPNGYWGDSRVQVNAEISRYWIKEISDQSFWLHSGK